MQGVGGAGALGAAGGQTVRQLRLAAELEGFYRQLFLPLVRRAIWKHGLSKEDAQDVVQDAFLLAVVKLKASGNGPVWLARVVDQLSVNFRRKGARHVRLEARWLNPDLPSNPGETGVELESWRQLE